LVPIVVASGGDGPPDEPEVQSRAGIDTSGEAGVGAGGSETAASQKTVTPAPEPELPDVVLISVDTLRADRLGAWGYHRDTSPHMDALAEQSVVWERCFTPMATTLPAHVSLVTAMHPYEHGVLANATHIDHRFRPEKTMRSFIELAREAGYHTRGFVSAAPLDPETGFAHGFVGYHAPNVRYVRAETTNEKVLAFLDAWDGDRPLLLFVHYFDPHGPYDPPEPYDEMFEANDDQRAWLRERGIEPKGRRTPEREFDTSQINDLYDGEVRYVDAEIGRLFDALREAEVWDDASVVLFGDHGEALGEDGYVGHGDVGHEQVHVPLMMRIPGIEPERRSRPMRLQDVVPTLVEMLALEEHFAPLLEQASGRARWNGSSAAKRRVLALRSHRTKKGREGEALALYRGKNKYILRTEEDDDLFVLSKDPHTTVDRIEDLPRVAKSMRREIRTIERAYVDRGLDIRAESPDEAGEISPALLERLRSLGYVD
jgi:arylsulfatase